MKNKSHWWHTASAIGMIALYVFRSDEPERIVYLFAATFAVIHGAAEKVINYMKSQTDKT